MITHDDPAEVLCTRCGWLKAAYDHEEAVRMGSGHDCDRDIFDRSYIGHA